MTTPAPAIDIDRLALSQELLTIAEDFAMEGKLWKEHHAKNECQRVANHLAELARHVVRGNADLEKADAYARAGAAIYGNIVATRRFFTSIIRLSSEETKR